MFILPQLPNRDGDENLFKLSFFINSLLQHTFQVLYLDNILFKLSILRMPLW